ncbi:tyrosine-type recombinase/integrase [Agrobacterium tumefaciens]|nr:tyrosine-type recombinase/integrase [Agrobacterium tumefaciens]
MDRKRQEFLLLKQSLGALPCHLEAEYLAHSREPFFSAARLASICRKSFAISRSFPVSIARRALKRAQITGLRSHHAHIFRHTFATMAIRSGVSLTELAQVLRHKEPNTTRIYAKLDTEGLRSLARPWLGASL